MGKRQPNMVMVGGWRVGDSQIWKQWVGSGRKQPNMVMVGGYSQT